LNLISQGLRDAHGLVTRMLKAEFGGFSSPKCSGHGQLEKPGDIRPGLHGHFSNRSRNFDARNRQLSSRVIVLHQDGTFDQSAILLKTVTDH
jgi:hypothetical protein